MQDLLILDNATSSSNGYIFASIAVLSFIFYGIQFLAYNLTGNEVAISYLLYEIAETGLKNHLSNTMESALLFNNLTDKYNLVMSAELLEKFKINVDTVQFLVLHSSVVRLVLFSINPDLSITIYAEAIINEHTTAADLVIMKTQFNTYLSTLVAIKGAIEIKITILINNVEGLLLRPVIFLPIIDFMSIYTCSLFYHVLGYPEITNYINDISNNLPTLFQDMQLLIARCTDIFETATSSVAVEDDEDAELLWYILRGESLLIKYLEAIHNVYAPIQPVNSYVPYPIEQLL